MQHLTGGKRQFLAGGCIVVAEYEVQPSAQDAGELFVEVRMGGNETPFFEEDVGDHGLLTNDTTALQQGHRLVLGKLAPTVANGGSRKGHGSFLHTNRSILFPDLFLSQRTDDTIRGRGDEGPQK